MGRTVCGKSERGVLYSEYVDQGSERGISTRTTVRMYKILTLGKKKDAVRSFPRHYEYMSNHNMPSGCPRGRTRDSCLASQC